LHQPGILDVFRRAVDVQDMRAMGARSHCFARLNAAARQRLVPCQAPVSARHPDSGSRSTSLISTLGSKTTERITKTAPH
jgi:hypothetical protein